MIIDKEHIIKYPELNKEYKVFDDGKINLGRMFEVIPFKIDIIGNSPFFNYIRIDLINHSGLYFIPVELEKLPIVYAKVKESDKIGQKYLAYTLTKQFEWFGIGSDWDGLLDLDSKYFKRLNHEN